MSKKSTKIIAAAGVVAGLGVAALPALTFAVGVNGQADIYAEVLPAIAMTIVGNNDDTDGAGTSSEQEYTTNPVTAGVGVSAPNGVTAIGSYIPSSMDIANGRSSSYIFLLPNATVDGNDTNGFKSTVTVYTNATSGYHLAIKADTSTDLTKIGASDVIPAGTITSPATTFDLSAGTAAWGYKVNTSATGGVGYKAITLSDVDIETTATASTSGDATEVYYGVATAADQATGVYKGTVVYTATTN